MKIASYFFLQMIGQYLYYYNSQKFWRNYINRMDMFTDKCNILSPSQNGFRCSMSTTEALLDLVEEITTSLEKINILLEYLLT